jgi:hypothetical protein
MRRSSSVMLLHEESWGMAKHPPAHHRSESPTRYSSTSRSPAELVSASPAASSFTGTAESVHNYSANGSVQHRRLSHLWGAPHSVHAYVLSATRCDSSHSSDSENVGRSERDRFAVSHNLNNTPAGHNRYAECCRLERYVSAPAL